MHGRQADAMSKAQATRDGWRHQKATSTDTKQSQADDKIAARMRIDMGGGAEKQRQMVRRLRYLAGIATEAEMDTGTRGDMIARRKTIPNGNGDDQGRPETNRVKTNMAKSKNATSPGEETTKIASTHGACRTGEYLHGHDHDHDHLIPQSTENTADTETGLAPEAQNADPPPPNHLNPAATTPNPPPPQHPPPPTPSKPSSAPSLPRAHRPSAPKAATRTNRKTAASNRASPPRTIPPRTCARHLT